MGLFDDLNRLLETQLDEFLKKNPHLELQALEEQLKQQEEDTIVLIGKLQQEEKQLQERILNIAKDIQLWHSRIDKAKAAQRIDLANGAAEREAALLRQGNQVWGQMEGVKQRLLQTKKLLEQIKQKRQDLKQKFTETQTINTNTSDRTTSGWERGSTYTANRSGADPLDAQFQRWEMDEELEKMKRDLKK
jgi:uncharacterized protein (TIGR04376 family)